ncbi:MAG: hypothetical protein ACKOA2_10285 [Ilumatobacteraceae bacterium]
MRSRILWVVGLVAVGVLAAQASGDAVRLTEASAAVGSDGTLIVTFSIDGLDSGERIDVTAMTIVDVEWTCVSKDGSATRTARDEAVEAEMTSSFVAGVDGVVTGAVVLPALEAPGDLGCDWASSVEPSLLTYADIWVFDLGNRVAATINPVSAVRDP